ncbi:hypothetical protein HY734_00275 [Candidatus Uhrbacteria bacterium]|nr:hypothetical protein [Candidatus Uhrbacteria bacterium]
MSTDDFLNDDGSLPDLDEAVFEPEPEEANLECVSSRAAEPDPRLDLAKRILKQLQENLGQVVALLDGASPASAGSAVARLVTAKKDLERTLDGTSGARVLEGVFDGQHMVGADGKSYPVPPNYASKSRLVEGDILKLTITREGAFLFKQIGPIARRRLTGMLAFDAASGNYVALVGEQTYTLLTASVTYYRGEPGDHVVVLVPKSTPTVWAAVENVVKK